MASTIHDIAKRAGVSLATVSRVLNNYPYINANTKLKVELAMKELNYLPSAYARSLSNQSSNIIGVVVPEISNPFFGGIIKGISAIADEQNYNIILCNTDENLEKESNALRMLQEYRVKGLIITPVTGTDEYDKQYVETFKKINIPLILADRDIKYGSFKGVFFDDTTALFDLTSLLIKNGHRDIAILAGNSQHIVTKRRVDGYITAFRANGLDYNPGNVYASPFSIEGAYEITKNLILNKKLPTAFIGNTNMLSMGCLKALTEFNIKIPDDVAFVGYDKLEMHEILHLNFTLAEKDVELLGRRAMELLLESFSDNASESNKVILSSKMFVRGSEKFPINRKTEMHST